MCVFVGVDVGQAEPTALQLWICAPASARSPRRVCGRRLTGREAAQFRTAGDLLPHREAGDLPAEQCRIAIDQDNVAADAQAVSRYPRVAASIGSDALPSELSMVKTPRRFSSRTAWLTPLVKPKSSAFTMSRFTRLSLSSEPA